MRAVVYSRDYSYGGLSTYQTYSASRIATSEDDGWCLWDQGFYEGVTSCEGVAVRFIATGVITVGEDDG